MAHQSSKYLLIILEIITVVAVDLIKKQRKEPVNFTLVWFTSRVQSEKSRNLTISQTLTFPEVKRVFSSSN